MPIYEYRCEKCHELTEVIRSMAAADEPMACEACGHDQTARVHSVFSAGSGQPDPMPMGGCGSCGDPGATCPFR